jgi:nucleotide-binding universal stress UspA family protein
MYKHILVPLDGSTLAESALPAAAYLAGKLHSRVTLLHVIEENAPAEIHGERHLTAPDEAQRYLKELAGNQFRNGIRVEAHVHREEVQNVARSIVSHSQDEFAPDLIILSAHGHGGLRDIFMGNIAQQVLTLGQIPILLIDVPEDVSCKDCFELKTILLPIDGNPSHEQAFTSGVDLAKACGSGVILYMVIPTLTSLKGEKGATGLFLPGAMSLALEQAEEEAGSYMKEHMLRLKKAGVNGTSAIVRGDPAGQIAEAAKNANVDLIILGTHQKSGSDAFWSASVASKVSRISQKPILFVPVK